MLSIVPVPAPPTPREIEHRFIQNVRKKFRELENRSEWDIDFPKDEHLRYSADQFFEGNCLKILTCSWDEWIGYMNDAYGFSTWGRGGWGVGSSGHYYKMGGYRRFSCLLNKNLAFREGERYRRQPHHEKKVPDESPKAQWRKETGHARDKGRHGYKMTYRSDRAGRWGKTWNHRKNRRWANRELRQGNYDAVTPQIKDIMRIWWD